jgi:hypothetical protein
LLQASKNKLTITCRNEQIRGLADHAMFVNDPDLVSPAVLMVHVQNEQDRPVFVVPDHVLVLVLGLGDQNTIVVPVDLGLGILGGVVAAEHGLAVHAHRAVGHCAQDARLELLVAAGSHGRLLDGLAVAERGAGEFVVDEGGLRVGS